MMRSIDLVSSGSITACREGLQSTRCGRSETFRLSTYDHNGTTSYRSSACFKPNA